MPRKNGVKIPPPLLRGEFRPETLNEENRTVEVIFTTGEGVTRYDWKNDTSFIEELEVTQTAVRTGRLDKGLSALDNHDHWRGIKGVFGITEAYRFEDGSLIGTVRFASDTESDIIFTKVKEKILKHVSLGYKVYRYLRTSYEDDKLERRTAVDWEPLELSFTPISAETKNGVRSDEQSDSLDDVEIVDRRVDKMTKKKDDLKPNDSPPEGADSGDVKPVEIRKIEPTPPEPVTVVTEPPAVSRADQLEPYLVAARKAGFEDSMATDAFMAGTRVDEFRTQVIEKIYELQKGKDVNLRSDGRSDHNENNRKGAEEAFEYRAGKKQLDDLGESARQFVGYTVFDVARHFLEQSGVPTRGMSRQKIAERAFMTTTDMPLIFENVMNKSLQRGYNETTQTFKDLGQQSTVNDFRDKHMYQVGGAPNLLPLGENGEYRGGSISEAKEKYRISTFARKIGYTRQMMINDDMSALTETPEFFGQAGSRLESDIVWGLLLNYDFIKNEAANHVMNDGNPLFYVPSNNLLTGATSAMSKQALSDMRLLGRTMKTLDGQFMNVSFDELVVPGEIETDTEDQLVNSFVAVTAGTTSSFTNKMTFRVEPRLSAVSLTAWYAFTKMFKSFEYAYLAGEENMYTEAVSSHDVDGVMILGRKDFGAGLKERRGVAKATGTA